MARIVFSLIIFSMILSEDAFAEGFFSRLFSTYEDKMDSHERGTWDYLENAEAKALRSLKGLLTANAVTLNHRKTGANHDHWNELVQAYCTAYRTITGFYGAIGKGSATRLEYPSSLHWRQASVGELKALSKRLRQYRNCQEVPASLRSAVFSTVLKYERRRLTYIKSVKGRPKTYWIDAWSGSLGMEIPGIPLKFEILNGVLSLKVSRNIGVFKFDGLLGQKQNYSGIETLWIFDTSGNIRIYTIRGKPMSFEVPASVISFNGSVVTVRPR